MNIFWTHELLIVFLSTAHGFHYPKNNFCKHKDTLHKIFILEALLINTLAFFLDFLSLDSLLRRAGNNLCMEERWRYIEEKPFVNHIKCLSCQKCNRRVWCERKLERWGAQTFNVLIKINMTGSTLKRVFLPHLFNPFPLFPKNPRKLFMFKSRTDIYEGSSFLLYDSLHTR